MTYEAAMDDLYEAINDAIEAADNEDGAPVAALRKVLEDVVSIANTGMNVAEYKSMHDLYMGEKQAGLVG